MANPLDTQDMKALGTLAIMGVVVVVLVGGFISDAQDNSLLYDTGSEFESGVLTDTTVVNDTVELEGDNETGTWSTGLLDNEVYNDLETNYTFNGGDEGTLTVEYYNDTQNLSDSPESTESFTLEDGQNEFDLEHDDSYDQINFEVELETSSTTESSPALTAFNAEGEKSGLTWVILGFLTAVLAAVILIRIMGSI